MPGSRRTSQSKTKRHASTVERIETGFVRGTLNAQKLRSLLDRDIERGRIAAERSNKISRKHYASILGCSPSALTRFADLFDEYESRLRIDTGLMRYYPEMQKWLSNAYRTGVLAIRDEKVDRRAFQRQFNLRGGNYITRYPKIRELFNSYDAKVQKDGYLPRSTKADLARVQRVLSGNPPLCRDRVTINRVELAKRVGISVVKFRSGVFKDAIAERQAELARKAVASSVDPYIHGRVFAFSGLVGAWPKRFVVRVAVTFKRGASAFAGHGTKGVYLRLVNALDWIGVGHNSCCRGVVKEAKEKGRVVSAGEWEDAVFAYRRHLIGTVAAGSATETGIDADISSLRIGLQMLSAGKVVPEMAMSLPGIKYAGRLTSHRRSVAEAPLRAGKPPELDYVGFVRDRYRRACELAEVDVDISGEDAFVRGIASDLRSMPDLPVRPADAVRLVLDRRLDVLRDKASALLRLAMRELEHGRELVATADIDGAAFESAYIAAKRDRREQARLLRSYFPCSVPSKAACPGRGVANLLALVQQRHQGVPPRGFGSQVIADFGQFFAKRYLEYGGLQSIEPWLIPSASAVGAVLTLYLLESGANVSVGRTLDRECIERSDTHDYCRVTGYKARARGRPIIVDLPLTSSAVVGIKWLLQAGDPLRATAKHDQDRLFLVRMGSRVQLITPHWYTHWFKSFAASEPGLHGVELLPSMIRPSVLLRAALNNDGRLLVGQSIAQHGLAVSQGYQQKWPTRMLYDENVRRFQSALETVILSGVEEAASKIGITPAQFKERLGNLRATGLGTFCRDQRGRSGENGTRCETVDCWNGCPHMLIVAEVEAIAALQLWQRSLRAVQPEWERDQPQRWDEVWLPWLCLTDVVEEKMVRGPLVTVWSAATRRAEEISAQPSYVAPSPW